MSEVIIYHESSSFQFLENGGVELGSFVARMHVIPPIEPEALLEQVTRTDDAEAVGISHVTTDPTKTILEVTVAKQISRSSTERQLDDVALKIEELHKAPVRGHYVSGAEVDHGYTLSFPPIKHRIEDRLHI